MSSATMIGLPVVDPRAGEPIFGDVMLYIL
jgi:hypothetical protein